jgi:ABC-type Mn2+/Zn2+ transport system permease subunit
MLRTIAGIVVGYLIFAVPSFLLFRLTHTDPHAPAPVMFEGIAIILGMVFASLAGYFGTTISRRRTMWVAFTIAAILAAGAIFSMIATGVNWSPMWALICMAPAAVAGGWFRLQQHSPHDKGAQS